MRKTIQVPNKYLVWIKYNNIQEGTPTWAWSLVYSGNSEEQAIADALDVQGQGEVVITKQLVHKLVEISEL